jgi:hypothetical protein
MRCLPKQFVLSVLQDYNVGLFTESCVHHLVVFSICQSMQQPDPILVDVALNLMHMLFQLVAYEPEDNLVIRCSQMRFFPLLFLSFSGLRLAQEFLARKPKLPGPQKHSLCGCGRVESSLCSYQFVFFPFVLNHRWVAMSADPCRPFWALSVSTFISTYLGQLGWLIDRRRNAPQGYAFLRMH